jgi:hypothetical protein
VDEADADRALDALISWGLVAERDGHIVGTPRWGAKLQAAAEKINLVAARAGGSPPVGNPLVLAVTQALANENHTTDDALFGDCVRVLVTLELSRMTPEKRAQYGFSDEATGLRP